MIAERIDAIGVEWRVGSVIGKPGGFDQGMMTAILPVMIDDD